MVALELVRRGTTALVRSSRTSDHECDSYSVAAEHLSVVSQDDLEQDEILGQLAVTIMIQI